MAVLLQVFGRKYSLAAAWLLFIQIRAPEAECGGGPNVVLAHGHEQHGVSEILIDNMVLHGLLH